jgi:3-oxosteroid 1-dehydrogenase
MSNIESPPADRECDYLVIGSGAPGMTAAITASALGGDVIIAERASAVGGTSAVSGGISWIPAHQRDPEIPLPIEDAIAYLQSLSNGSQDPVLVDAFVRTGAAAVEFLEAQSPIRYEIAKGFPDYKPEHPGGRPEGGRSLSPLPIAYSQLGEWADRVMQFPQDFSNVGFDAETRARLSSGVDSIEQTALAGQALIVSLLRGLLDRGIVPLTEWRARHLVVEYGAVIGAVFDTPEGRQTIRARKGVILASGGFEWDPELVRAFLRGPMRGPVSPPNNTGDSLRMAMEIGSALGNMREAWWVPVIKIPGDTMDGHERSRSVRLERTRPRSIMVNSKGRRFVNEASDYNSMGGAFHQIDVGDFSFSNNPAWLVFDQGHLDSYGFLSVPPEGQPLDWFNASADLAELAA